MRVLFGKALKFFAPTGKTRKVGDLDSWPALEVNSQGGSIQIWALVALIFMTGCFYSPLRVRREIEGPWALPSVQLETPDPNVGKDQTGERLVVHWSLPQHIKFAQLMVKVRLSDATVEHFSFPLAKSWGHWIHRWNGSTNAEKLPIVAYCAEVWSRDRLIAAKVHPLWMEPPALQENQRKNIEKSNDRAS